MALNDVPAGLESVLTPLSQLFLPAGIAVVIVLAVGYVVARNRSVHARGRRGGGRWCRVGAGGPGEGHCRPPQAL